MTIQDLGSLSELVAAAATLATLVYLARQIRQNTSSARSVNFATYAQSINQANDALRGISDFVNEALSDSRPLTPRETALFQTWCSQVCNAAEVVFLFRAEGSVDEAYFEAKMNPVRFILATKGGKTFWAQNQLMGGFDPRFVEYVDRLGERAA